MDSREQGADAAQRLFDEVALWLTVPSSAEALISAACDALVQGSDGPFVVDLAGRSPKSSEWDLTDLIADVLQELGLPTLERDSEAAQLAAARAMCRKFLKGLVPARDLAQWAHRHIGHEGAASLQDLVILDDDYDIAEMRDVPQAEFDAKVAKEAARLLATWPAV